MSMASVSIKMARAISEGKISCRKSFIMPPSQPSALIRSCPGQLTRSAWVRGSYTATLLAIFIDPSRALQSLRHGVPRQRIEYDVDAESRPRYQGEQPEKVFVRGFVDDEVKGEGTRGVVDSRLRTQQEMSATTRLFAYVERENKSGHIRPHLTGRYVTQPCLKHPLALSVPHLSDEDSLSPHDKPVSLHHGRPSCLASSIRASCSDPA